MVSRVALIPAFAGMTAGERVAFVTMTPATSIIDIFTDGACSGNPGPGGWAAILRLARRERELSRRRSCRRLTTAWS